MKYVIKGNLYCVTYGVGHKLFVETDTLEALIEFVVEFEKQQIVHSVVYIDKEGLKGLRTPRVPIKTNPYYKELKGLK